ncbi:MAG TPA: Tol-Pal system beta propeller repeat protein TolB [Steroidobacteraceae bacterium]|jgi:TolB protein|nr:Tol-Pal system beta propeller repeat protein TolB [Steroidobacteraceae bacterium]
MLATVTAGASLLFALAPARAELTIEITEGVTDPIPIAIVPFGWHGVDQAPTDVADVVASDLQRSGRFRPMARADMVDLPTKASEVVIDDWRLLRNDFVVVGELQPGAPGQYEIRYALVNVLNGQKMLEYTQPATTSTLRAASHRVSDRIFEKLTGIPGAFSTRVAYVSVLGQAPNTRYQLIVADADGMNPRVVTQSSEPIMSPAWSPDGQNIAYVSFENRAASVFVQLLRTGERRRVSARAGINGAPAWSPDGKRLALTLSHKDGNLDVYVLGLTDQVLTRVTEDNAIDTEPCWSADGKTIYFTSDRSGAPQIYRVGLGAGERAQRVTFEGTYNARPRVSPDGSQLAMVTLDRGAYRIAVMNLKNNSTRVLTQGNLDESPSFAPNGAVLIYGTQDKGRGVLATVSVDGSVHQRIAAEQGDIREPIWSPLPAS